MCIEIIIGAKTGIIEDLIYTPAALTTKYMIAQGHTVPVTGVATMLADDISVGMGGFGLHQVGEINILMSFIAGLKN